MSKIVVCVSNILDPQDLSLRGSKTTVRVWERDSLADLIEEVHKEVSEVVVETFGVDKEVATLLAYTYPSSIFDNELPESSESNEISHTISTMASLRNEITLLDKAIDALKAQPGYDGDQLSTFNTAKANLEDLLMELSRKHLATS